jgi:hypothetical protein
MTVSPRTGSRSGLNGRGVPVRPHGGSQHHIGRQELRTPAAPRQVRHGLPERSKARRSPRSRPPAGVDKRPVSSRSAAAKRPLMPSGRCCKPAQEPQGDRCPDDGAIAADRASFAGPEDAEAGQHDANRELDRVLRRASAGGSSPPAAPALASTGNSQSTRPAPTGARLSQARGIRQKQRVKPL